MTTYEREIYPIITSSARHLTVERLTQEPSATYACYQSQIKPKPAQKASFIDLFREGGAFRIVPEINLHGEPEQSFTGIPGLLDLLTCDPAFCGSTA